MKSDSRHAERYFTRRFRTPLIVWILAILWTLYANWGPVSMLFPKALFLIEIPATIGAENDKGNAHADHA